MAPEDFYVFGFDQAADDALQFSWLTRSETGNHSIVRATLPSVTLRELRDDHRRVNLANVWPRPLVAALERHLSACRGSPPARIRLCLHHSTARSSREETALTWEQLPIEYLYVAGTRLRDLATVERAVPRLPDGAPVTRGKVLLLNRWFARAGQDAAWEPPPSDAGSGLRVYDGPDVEPFLHKHHDLTGSAALFLIAHGDRPQAHEDTAIEPHFCVRSRAGAREELWNPMQDRTLPALVGLLACADDDCRLAEYGRSLLSDSTRCVLVPVGRIDAEQAALFTGEFARAWQAGVTVRDALRAVAADHSPSGAMHKDLLDRLWILGDADIHRVDSPRAASECTLPLHALPAADLRARRAQSPQAHAILLDRATCRSVAQTGSLRGAIRETSGLFDLDSTHDAAARRLMKQLDRAFARVAPVTQRWLAQYLVGLGERYDHRLMQHYQDVASRDRSQSFGIPQFVAKRCLAFARNGEFAEGAACLAQGFETLRQLGDVPLERFELVGVLLNYLIDFNLPDLARHIAEQIDQEAAGLPDDIDVRFFRFTLLDRSARAAFRAGRVGRGFELMRRKYQQARARGEDGGRELAWLIYLASWGDRSARQTCRDMDLLDDATRTVKRALAASRQTSPNELIGNDNEAYLLRALAAWHWASPLRTRERSRVGKLLRKAWPQTTWHLSRRDDVGPFGLAIGYLAAAGLPEARRAWLQARNRLLAARYDSETVGLSLLQGRIDEQIVQALRDFQQARRTAVSRLELVLTSSIDGLDSMALTTQVAARSASETQLLEQAPDLSASQLRDRLLGTGLVPI